MKEELKNAKKNMKMGMRPYTTYGYYLALPILFIAIFILGLVGVELDNIGIILLVFTVMANIDASKLTKISKRKYVAPILVYSQNILGLILVIPMIISVSSNGLSEMSLVFVGLVALLTLPIHIVAIIFFFLTANDIKKNYPDMKMLAKEARDTYMIIKKSN